MYDIDGEIWTSWTKVVLKPHGADFLPQCQAMPVDGLTLTDAECG